MENTLNSKFIIKLNILLLIFIIVFDVNFLMSKTKINNYEVKLFVTDNYTLTCNFELLKAFQMGLENLNTKYNWNIVNSNVDRFDYLKVNDDFNGLKNLYLDTMNRDARYFNLDDFPVILLLKDNEIIYKTNNFAFSYLKEVLEYEKHTDYLTLDSTILDVKQLLIKENIFYIKDEIKNCIFKVENLRTKQIDLVKIIKNKFDFNIFGDITIDNLFLFEEIPVALLKFNTLKEGGETDYYELLIDLEKLEIIEYNYDENSYIIGDAIHSFCNNLTYTCFHYDYYKHEKKNLIKEQPILATLSKNNKVFYHSTISEIENYINSEFRYLYVLQTFSIKNKILIFQPALGLSLYSEYNCDSNSINQLKQFEFKNSECKKIFESIELNDPYGTDLSGSSEYYFEGIKPIDTDYFALVFRSKKENQDGLLEYILFIYNSEFDFIYKKSYAILNYEVNDKIIDTFFIPNLENKIIIGIKSQIYPFKLFKPTD